MALGGVAPRTGPGAAGMPPQPAPVLPVAPPQPPGASELRLQQSVYEHQRQKLALESAIVSALQELNNHKKCK